MIIIIIIEYRQLASCFVFYSNFEILGQLVRGLKASNTRKPLEFRLAIGSSENSRTFRLSQSPKKLSVADLSYFQLTVYDQGEMFIIGCEISFILRLPRSCQNEKNRTVYRSELLSLTRSKRSIQQIIQCNETKWNKTKTGKYFCGVQKQNITKP